VSLIVGVIASLTESPNYYGKSNWDIKANKNNRVNVKLDEFDLKVLAMIRNGHQYLADISDGLSVDAKISNLSIEKLDQGGYIERAGLKGSKFFTFNTTEKANEVLPKLNETESKLLEDYLNSKYLKFIEMAKNNPEKIGLFAKEFNMGSLQMSSMISHLTRRGYIKEKGMFKRQVEITDKGSSILQKYANIGGNV
jgi:SSS family solute:Na+ symporter